MWRTVLRATDAPDPSRAHPVPAAAERIEVPREPGESARD
jgi:hypothetical protein